MFYCHHRLCALQNCDNDEIILLKRASIELASERMTSSAPAQTVRYPATPSFEKFRTAHISLALNAPWCRSNLQNIHCRA